ncbi:MAG: nitronate monooxygenase [Candidatus Lambdaproteobacteria bacterium RIFOXYD1_FULL_56_27]|uniref:Nitronate monooxygenase n=1 Tax=Candidatus Lambdaproteobacteria bacterium RIFOXYD2_FULL_56_26 TaxID=1817773 RepID=A0A1F6GZL0_9PROT|nr:MAG: nitronate monooxygenase [Candidatus Lambdaproteobacteria bacterium RIFOXYC1_FULL_56_13]OGH03603.1 MAG: nitronate monooxygenase [Candidatus Lambdaproteobacteria bacterium RIFOXYD2_FULL_56_26]OGH06789.1 MAG: nitronate monooxygenase [Candidatus Lambdaproteobacteria bacterium RIFOXYD1_FULL_56_27]
MKTRLTELLGIRYPVIQGGMMWVSRAPLVAAVSNAGGLGVLTALSLPSPELVIQEIAEIRKRTNQPFGVNLTFLPTLKPVPYEAYAQAILSTGVKIIETAGRNPEPYMALLKQAGVKVIHKCTSLKHALKAEAIGVDVVSIDGFECAGHPGEQDVGGLVLFPVVAGALKIPVVGSGGLADGRGLAAALALGCEGINLGTRFLATQESPVHQRIKEALLGADETSTILVERSLKNSLRVLRNRQADKVLVMEARGAELAELAPHLSGRLGLAALESGDPEGFLFACGQSVGLVKDIPTCAELIERMVAEAKEILLHRLPALF